MSRFHKTAAILVLLSTATRTKMLRMRRNLTPAGNGGRVVTYHRNSRPENQPHIDEIDCGESTSWPSMMFSMCLPVVKVSVLKQTLTSSL